MATDEEARARGFVTPYGTDVLRDGDNAITANAKVTVDVVNAATANARAATDALAARTFSLTYLGSVSGQVAPTLARTIALDAAAPVSVTLPDAPEGQPVRVLAYSGAYRLTFPGVTWAAGAPPALGDVGAVDFVKARNGWVGLVTPTSAPTASDVQTAIADAAAAKADAAAARSDAAGAKADASTATGSTDAATAQNITTGTQTPTALRAAIAAAVSSTTFGPVVSTSDDTAGLLAAMQDAARDGRAFSVRPGLTFNVRNLTIPAGTRLMGGLTLKAVAGADYVARLANATYNLEGSQLSIDASGAIDGLQLFNAGRSKFGEVTAQRAMRSGIRLLQTDGVTKGSNNNNLTSWKHVRVALNGSKFTDANAKVTSQTGTATSLNVGYSTLTLSTPLPAWAVDVTFNSEVTRAVYFAIIDGQAYRVRSVDSTTQVTLYNLPATAAGTTVNLVLVVGAGLDVPKFHDNHKGSILMLDAQSNAGIGFAHSPGYGWNVSAGGVQGNTIGLGVWDYSQATNLIGPYFELNTLDVVIGTSLDATMTSPLGGTNVQSLADRLTVRGQTFHPGITWMGSPGGQGGRVGPVRADTLPTNNPGTTTVTPGNSYAFSRSAGNFAFRIGSAPNATTYGASKIEIDMKCTGAWSGTITVSFDTTSGYAKDETVEGAATWTSSTLSAGPHRLVLFKVGKDWQTTLT